MSKRRPVTGLTALQRNLPDLDSSMRKKILGPHYFNMPPVGSSCKTCRKSMKDRIHVVLR